jgi:hypothetical protein
MGIIPCHPTCRDSWLWAHIAPILRVASPAVAAVQDLRRHGHQHRRPSRRPQTVSVGLRGVLSCVAKRFPCAATCRPAFFCYHAQLCVGPGNHVGDTRIPPRRWLRGPRCVEFVVRMRAVCAPLPAQSCAHTLTHTLVRGYSACGVERVWAVEACGGSRQSAAALCVTDVVFHRRSLQVAGLLAAERDHCQATGRRPRVSEGAIDSPDGWRHAPRLGWHTGLRLGTERWFSA